MEEIVEDHNVRAKFRTTFQNAVSRLRNDRKLVSKTFIFCDLPWNIDLTNVVGEVNIFLNCKFKILAKLFKLELNFLRFGDEAWIFI